MRQLLVLALVSVCIWQVNSQCRLTEDQVKKNKRIFAERRFRNNVRLFRKDVVASGQNLLIICSATDMTEVQCRQGQFTPALPTDCDKPLKKVVEKVEDSTFNCPGKLYRVGYRLNDVFLELYRTCYDAAEVRLNFTVHDLYATTLQGIRPSSSKFRMDSIISGADASSFENSQIFIQFNNIFDNQQNYIQKIKGNRVDLVFHRGHAVPSNDFMFHDNKVLTLTYVNVVPQFSSINGGNWYKVEQRVRALSVANPTQPLRVCTGTLDVLELQSKKIYLLKDDRNPVPKWLFKSVIVGDTTHVFLTYNNIFDVTKPVARCTTITCDVALELSPDHRRGFTFCCNPEDFFNHIVPYLKGPCFATRKRPLSP